MNIGDRVMATGVIDDLDLTNKYGTIIHIGGHPRIKFGVQFEDMIGGHDCEGFGEHGYCWYCDEEHLSIIDESIEFEESGELLSFLQGFKQRS